MEGKNERERAIVSIARTFRIVPSLSSVAADRRDSYRSKASASVLSVSGAWPTIAVHENGDTEVLGGGDPSLRGTPALAPVPIRYICSRHSLFRRDSVCRLRLLLATSEHFSPFNWLVVVVVECTLV
jgi:hypothetical protein